MHENEKILQLLPGLDLDAFIYYCDCDYPPLGIVFHYVVI